MTMALMLGDTRPKFTAQMVDADGKPVDLTDATVGLVIRDATGTIVDPASRPVTILDPPTGAVFYNWQAADSAVAGNFRVTLVATLADGGILSYPVGRGIPLAVIDADHPLLVVDPDEIGRRVGLPQPLSDDDREDVTDRILDAQADVEGYLNRTIVPTITTEVVRDFIPRGGYTGNLVGAVRLPRYDVSNEPLISVLDAVDNDDDTWTVTYLGGLDAANDPRMRLIIAFIRQAAIASTLQGNVNAKRVIRSKSVEGQSLTYADASERSGTSRSAAAYSPANKQAGQAPTLASLSRWKRRMVYSRPRQSWINQPVNSAWSALPGSWLVVGPQGYDAWYVAGDTRVPGW